MKIKRVEEINENQTDNSIKELVRRILAILKMDVDVVEDSDPEIIDYIGDMILKWKENKKHGNIREVLPQMVSLSNNSRITQETAQTIVDKFDTKELMDFKRWLQLINR